MTRALLIFIILLCSFAGRSQIRLHQIESLPVEFHAPGTLYAIGDIVKTSNGLYRATASTTTTPPSADWVAFDTGGGGADGNGILDGGQNDVIPSGSRFKFPIAPGLGTNGSEMLFGFPSGTNRNSSGFVYVSEDFDPASAAFSFAVDDFGNYIDSQFAFYDGDNTTRYMPGEIYFQGVSAPFGHRYLFTSTGLRFTGTIFGGDYIAIPFDGPSASTYGQVRVTDDLGNTTWEDYFPASLTGQVDAVVAGTNVSVDNTDPQNPIVSVPSLDDGDANPTNELQTLSIDGQDLTISSGNTVTLPSGGVGTPGNDSEYSFFTTADTDATTTPHVLNWNQVAPSTSGWLLTGQTDLSPPENGDYLVTATVGVSHDNRVELQVELLKNGTPLTPAVKDYVVRDVTQDEGAVTLIYALSLLTSDNISIRATSIIDGGGTAPVVPDITSLFVQRLDIADGTGADDQTLTLVGTDLSIEDGNTVDLSGLGGGTDDQTLTLVGTDLSIEAGNTVDLSTIQDGTGTDDQTLTLVGTDLSIEDGNTVDLSGLGGGTDDQTLSINGNDLTIENGNTVTLPSGAGADVFKINGSEVAPNGIWKKVGTLDINGADFGINRNTGLSGAAATYRGKYNRTYFAYYEDTNIEAFVNYYDHDTQTFGTPVSWGIPRSGAQDPHAYPEIIVTPKGHILLVQEQLTGTAAINNHNSPHWVRRSTNPEDISSYVESGPLSYYTSYPNLAIIGDTIHWTMRHQDHERIGYMFSDDDGQNWKRWDGTPVADNNDAMDIMVDLVNDNDWAYNWITRAEGYMIKTINHVNHSPNFAYPASYIIFSKDGRTWGNYEWMVGAAGAWSKDVPATSAITAAELQTNALAAGDATIDADSSNIVYDVILYGNEMHYVWGQGLRSGDNIWTNFFYTIHKPDGTKTNYSLTDGNALSSDVDQLIYAQIIATDDQLMVKVLNVDKGRIDVLSSSNGGKNWVLADSYNTIDSAPTGSTTGHGDRTSVDYDKGVACHISSAPSGLVVDIYEMTTRGAIVGGGGSGTDDQTLTLVGTDLSIEDGNTVDLSGLGGGTDDQTLSINGNDLTIENGNTVTLPSGGGGTPTFQGVRVEARTAQVFSTTYTKLNITYEDYDANNWFDIGLDRFQPDVAGYYMVTGGIVFAALAEGNVAIVELRKNGTRYCILSRGAGSASSGTNLGGYSGADIVYMNGTTDYLELWGWNGQASDRSIFVSDGYNRFSAHLIGN
jgi:hypothetical protein